MKIYRLTALTLVLVSMVTLLATCVAPTEKLSYEQATSQLQIVLDNAIYNPKIQGEYPGALLYVSGPGFGKWAGAVGQSDLHTSTAMNPDNRFQAGSIMESFVAVVILQLVEEGLFSLDDPLTVLHPTSAEMIPNSNSITARMLLNHTSNISKGLGVTINCDFSHMPRSTKGTSENPRSVLEMDYFTAEDDWFDSMTDYNLLGSIIGRVTGRTWKEEVRERIIQKLNLENTLILRDCENLQSTNRLRRYRSPTFHREVVLKKTMVGAAGGHALVTTAEDLTVFFDAVLAGQVFQNSETLDEMLDFVGAPWGVLPPEYGLGLQKLDSPYGELIGHADNRAGLTAAVLYLPDYEILIAAVINTQDWDGFTKRLLFPSLEILARFE